MVVLAVGAVEHDIICELTDALVTERATPGAVRTSPTLAPPTVRVIDQPGSQAHVVLGTPLGPLEPRERAALGVLSHLLGGGVSSRLFRQVREERGLAYGVGTELSLYAGAGSIAAYAASAPGAMGEVIELLAAAFDESGAGVVSDEEVERSSEALRTDLLLSADEPLTRLGRLGADALIHGTVIETSERVDLLSSIDADDVRAMASRIALGPRIATLVGPVRPGAVAALDRVVVR